MDNYQVKLTGFYEETKEVISFYVEPEIAERSTQDPEYKKRLIDTAGKIMMAKRKEDAQKQPSSATLVPLVMGNGIEQHTLYVSSADYELAKKDAFHAQKLFDTYMKTLTKVQNETVSTNFVKDDVPSIPSGSDVRLLELVDGRTNLCHRLTLSPEDYEHAMKSQQYATKLLLSYLEMKNLPINANCVNEKDIGKENDSNEGNIVSQVKCQKVLSVKKKQEKSDTERVRWTDEETRCLLSHYKKYVGDYDAEKLTYDKFWLKIFREMEDNGYDYTAKQCITKLDNLKRNYKKVMDNNNQTGREPITCEFFDELNELFSKKPWIQPLSVAGTNVALDMDEVDENHKSKKLKSSAMDLKKHFVEQTLNNQRLRMKQDADYKKQKLALFKQMIEKN